MAFYNLEYFWIAAISTSNPSGFNDASGNQFVLGVDTVTVANSAVTQTVVVDDKDPYFDDDGFDQVIPYDQWIDGVFIPGRTRFEAECTLFVQDPQGKTHTIQVIWANGDAFTI